MRALSAHPFSALVCCVLAVCVVAGVSAAGAAVYQVDLETDGLVTACTAAPADCSLRGAIENSNGNPGVDSIDFEGVSLVTLTLLGDEDLNQSGDLDLLDPVLIDGASAVTVDASLIGDRVFHVLTSGSPDSSLLTGLTITGGNLVGSTGGGVRCFNSTLMIEDSLIVGNFKSGVSVGTDCALGILGTTIEGNSGAIGGGILFLGNQPLSITASAVIGNDAGNRGGGLASNLASNALVMIDNTTFSGNTAGMGGSAISTFGPLSLESVTIVSEVEAGSAVRHFGLDAETTFKNTLIQGSCQNDPESTLTSLAGNLESPGDTCNLTPGLDQISVSDPMLAPLATCAGATPSHRPDADSPAVDDPLDAMTDCTIYDQRLFDRPEDGNGDDIAKCDIGAIERRPPGIFTDGFESGDTSAWSNTTQ